MAADLSGGPHQHAIHGMNSGEVRAAHCQDILPCGYDYAQQQVFDQVFTASAQDAQIRVQAYGGKKGEHEGRLV